MQAAASMPEPAKAECKSATSNTIFDHIRKKSKDFPTLMLSKSMDSSYEPLILKKMKTSRDQFGVERISLQAGGIMPMDSEPAEPRVSPTSMLFTGKRDNPSEKKIMITPGESPLRFSGENDISLEKSKILIDAPDENSHLQLAAKRSSPSEKSKVLTTLDECSLGLAGGKGSPLEKSNILIRTPVENPFRKGTPAENSPLAAKRDGLSEKRKFSFSGPLPCFQAEQCTKKEVRPAYRPFNIEEYIKEILQKPKDSGSGDSFLNCRSVFSFL